MSLLTLGTRASLQGGELSVYVPRAGGRWGLLRLALKAVLGRLDQARDSHSTTLSELEIRTRRPSLRVSFDGEVARMTSPIRYIIRPRALKVLVPTPGMASAAARRTSRISPTSISEPNTPRS